MVSKILDVPKVLGLGLFILSSLGCGKKTLHEELTTISNSEFSRVIHDFSESAGDFHSDNLISNEASYLQVAAQLRKMNIRGGAYIGVGPEQNFSYIAILKPEYAFILDIRRDNLMIHLFYKALFEMSEDRFSFLCLLFGKKPRHAAPDSASLQSLLDSLERPPSQEDKWEASHRDIEEHLAQYGVPLDTADLTKIFRIHAEFVRSGTALTYKLRDKPARSFYPTYRELALEKNEEGKSDGFLVNEQNYKYVRRMQQQNRIIPLVGDFAGKRTLLEIGRYLEEKKLTVSAFYTSNVEAYLFEDSLFERFAQNAVSLPRSKNSMFIRSCFRSAIGAPHPRSKPRYHSVQLLQNMNSFSEVFARGTYKTYEDLVFDRE